MFMPVHEDNGSFGIIYNNKVSLFVLGVIFFTCGAVLLLGKLCKKKYWVGKGLFACFLCFTFAAFVNMAAEGITTLSAWLPNTVAATLTAGLWLWWKFKTEYLNIQEFRQHAIALDKYKKLDK